MNSRETWRILMWVGAAVLLALPAIVMQFSNEVAWGPEDFLVVGALLVAMCGAVELAARSSKNLLFRAGVALAAIGGFLLVFINLAVGIIGDEGNPKNLVFFVIPAIGFVGALVGRFRPTLLIRLLAAMAAIQIAAIFLAPADMMRIMAPFTAIFVGLWLLAALLIRRSIAVS